jgi:CDP-paratose 2-epimerase
VKRLLITGAAGFIGTNCALGLKDEFELVLLDNFSRSGSTNNASILESHGLGVNNVDIGDSGELEVFLDRIGKFDALLHLAAQTSLLESFKHPKVDFNSNGLGTLNILEYLRTRNPDCKGIFLASNKVYGNLSQFDFKNDHKRFSPNGVNNSYSEELALMPVGGYSISKYISDAYVQEYGKRYSMPIFSLRQSAVYGRYQNPRTDQGWVVHFLRELSASHRVRLRGAGLQVRDILFVDDFVELVRKMLESELNYGDYFNVGGGISNSLSILELFDLFTEITGKEVKYETGIMDSEDQKYFVSNNSKITKFTGWHPRISPRDGITKILDYLEL